LVLREAGATGKLIGWIRRRLRRPWWLAPRGGGSPAAGEWRHALQLGTKEKEGGEEFLTARRSFGGRGNGEEDDGGRDRRQRPASMGGGGELDLGAMDPVDSNRYTCEPQARRRNEGEGLGGFNDDGGARAAAMAWRPALQSVAKAARAREGVGAWDCAKGGTEVAWVAYIGSGWCGEAVPRRPWPLMAGFEEE
jgi:hypothetical protein